MDEQEAKKLYDDIHVKLVASMRHSPEMSLADTVITAKVDDFVKSVAGGQSDFVLKKISKMLRPLIDGALDYLVQRVTDREASVLMGMRHMAENIDYGANPDHKAIVLEFVRVFTDARLQYLKGDADGQSGTPTS